MEKIFIGKHYLFYIAQIKLNMICHIKEDFSQGYLGIFRSN